MSIDEKNTNKTDKPYSVIVLDSRPMAEAFGIEPRPSDYIDHSITRHCNHRAQRCSAGSDSCCSNTGQSCGRRNSRTSNTGRGQWDDESGCRLPNSSPVFQDQGVLQSAQPVRDRVPIPCPCSPEPSRGQDRSGPSSGRIPLDRRGTYDVQQPPCGDQSARRCDYDVEPEPRNCSVQDGRRTTYDVPQPCAGPQNERRGTYNVSQPCAGPQNDRRGTYNVSQPCAGPQNDRRGTYNVSRPCAAAQNDRRGTYNVSQPCAGPQNDRRGTYNVSRPCAAARNDRSNVPAIPFSMTGTIQLNGFEQLSPVRRPPPNRSSSCSRLHDTDGDIEDFLDNHLDYDMVAPRAMALPGQPYVDIDESAANTTPEAWRLTIHDRSSLDSSRPMGISSPTCDYDAGCSRSRARSADSSTPRRWSSADRQSRPFGLNDSFAMNGGSAPRDRQSRARSAGPACSSSSRNNRRRDTFDRNTR
ncbi:Uncharacterized protein FWK35_00000389 [Aphis craccivora]|uniref:Uncharacterized protein n=1 Tax=Aphis craccivora TaxID=307492 RepID=A0A6G0ZL21_APHCR|nr:Uncharacterized protein FWK35_00000389 [Aphis craccivora]